MERWLVTGASGQLGSHVVRLLATEAGERSILALAGRHEVGTPGIEVRHVDLADQAGLRQVVTETRPTHVVHLAAMTAVGDCHARPADAERQNTEAPAVLAEAAGMLHARFVFSSTDMVFDGGAAPYREGDPPHPLSHYGRTKAAAEGAVQAIPSTLVVRVPLLYGFPCAPRESTFVQQMAAARTGQPVRLFTDEFRTPIGLADAARALIGLARSDYVGVIHVAGPERLSRYELVERCATALGIRGARLVPISREDVAAAEPRPADLSLDGSRFNGLFPHLVAGPIREDVLIDPSDGAGRR